MGMSASQARLIALTARMSDVEYEGQQINQQRLTLSNKISDIYAQMEAIQVPTPPSPQDFMVPAYKGKTASGENISVQNNGNGGFDYYKDVTGPIVRDSGQAKITTGVEVKGGIVTVKNKADGKLGLTSEGDTPEKYVNTSQEYDAEEFTELKAKDFSRIVRAEDQIKTPWQGGPCTEFVTGSYVERCDESAAGATRVNDSDGNLDHYEHTVTITDPAQRPTGDGIVNTQGLTTHHYEGTNPTVTEFVNTGLYKNNANYTSNGEKIDTIGGEVIKKQNADVAANKAKSFVTKDSNGEYAAYTGALPPSEGTILYESVDPAKFNELSEANKLLFKGVADQNTKQKLTADDLQGLYIVDEKGYAWPATVDNALEADGTLKAGIKLMDPKAGTEIFTDKSKGDTTINGNPTKSLDDARRDYKNNEAFNKALVGLQNSFPEDGEVTWKDFDVIILDNGKGFQFYMKEDLKSTKEGVIDDDEVTIWAPGTGTYQKKIGNSTENGAPTFDGTGQPQSVSIGGETVQLSAEKELDEVAYKSAEAEYTRKKNVYDAEQDALNRKTSTYQMEDKKLDLKLKRLDTERNALNTEIDAVKKVIQDATDKGFKTFSG